VIGGNGGHFWIQHPRKHKVYQKYSMQLKKNIFLQTCVINGLRIWGSSLLENHARRKNRQLSTTIIVTLRNYEQWSHSNVHCTTPHEDFCWFSFCFWADLVSLSLLVVSLLISFWSLLALLWSLVSLLWSLLVSGVLFAT
jgi:hypothetical protein